MRNVILALVVFALSITNGGVILAQSNARTTESQNKSIVEASFKAWNDGTGSPYDLLTDDATWTIVGRSAASKTYQGREAFMRDVIRPFNARMREPLKPVIRSIYTDGDAGHRVFCGLHHFEYSDSSRSGACVYGLATGGHRALRTDPEGPSPSRPSGVAAAEQTAHPNSGPRRRPAICLRRRAWRLPGST